MAMRLPNIFPAIGPVTRLVLFADFLAIEREPSLAEWQDEYSTIISHGLAGIALRVIRTESLSVPDDVMKGIRHAAFGAMALTMSVVKKSQAGVEALSSADIPFVITKGPGIASCSNSVSDRPFVDLDVLVGPSDFDRSRRILSSSGYRERRMAIQPWTWFARYAMEAVNLRTSDGGSIDLHHHISPWNWSDALGSNVFDGARNHDVFGLRLPLVNAEYNLLVAALHVVSDQSRPGQTLRVWRDLLVLSSCCSTESVVATATSCGLTEWLAWIVRCLPEEVRPPGLLGALEAADDTFKGRWRLQMLLKCAQHQAIGSIFRIPALNAVPYVGGSLVPSRSYMRIQYPGDDHPYLTRWKHLPQQFVLDSNMAPVS
jgi:hypothetical protein